MNYQNFTPAFKDQVLKVLCDSFRPYSLCHIKLKDLGDFDIALFDLCLKQFSELGLVSDYSLRNGICSLILYASAIDLLNSGGFVLRAEHLAKELEKLEFELDKLKADSGLKGNVEQITHISGVISNLIIAVKAFI